MAQVARIVSASDFERVLKTPTAARTQHFAVHHLGGGPQRLARHLSTGGAAAASVPVDDLPDELQGCAASWLGYVVPKRHARRAVTRSLLKRQIRAAVDRRPWLSAGLWVVRLRLAFDREAFPSAASAPLARAAGAELDLLLAQAARRVDGRPVAPGGTGS